MIIGLWSARACLLAVDVTVTVVVLTWLKIVRAVMAGRTRAGHQDVAYDVPPSGR